jgi:SAM-dependent methyltransferase
MAQIVFDEWIAERYETLWPELFDPAVLDPAVDLLAELAGAGPVLEFGVGTGRVALPLSRRGILVRGIELSPAMAARLRGQDGGAGIDVIVGDFATATAGAPVALVYLLRNTITNLTSQDEQVQAFANAAAHLGPGGCFLIENYVPELRRLPPGETTHVFIATADHVGVEEYDVAAQLALSRHYWNLDGQLRTFSSTHRYAWPAELDLMARIAGLRLRHRWSDWHRAPFTGESRSHISVWEKPGGIPRTEREPC